MPVTSRITTSSSKPFANLPSCLAYMTPRHAYADPDTDTDVMFDEEIDLLELLDEHSQLIVYNDDVNTFDWVIECLIDILGHDTVQAEQLAMLIHFKGKATVKSGPFEELHPLKDGLVDRGLSAVIEGTKV